jgi:hypothetical protein
MRQRPAERLDLRRGEVAEEPGEPLPQQGPGRLKRGLPCGREQEALAPPVISAAGAPLDEPVALEAAQELGHRRRRDARPAGEIGSEDIAPGHRLERAVLSGGQGRLVGREQALRPSGDQRRHSAEHVGDVLATRP